MLSRISRPMILRPLPSLFSISRGFADGAPLRFSPNAIYSSFPASLLRLNHGEKSNLFAYTKTSESEGKHIVDGVVLEQNGLVYPAISNQRPFSNGASMMPNTMFMQELARMAYDYYSEDLENGKAVETPLIFRIPKGTPLPSTLVLLHEHTAQFSLQPSFGMPLDDLNERLDEFYSKYAERTTLERWLTEHDYADAHDDTMPEDWMAE